MKSHLMIKLFSLLLISMAIFVSACSHRRTMQVGSHQVTIARHGFTKSIHNDQEAGTFAYLGTSLDGASYKVSITGDRVKVNDQDYGTLKKGDSVLITDDGLRVNSLDYGESERYLRANGGGAVQTAAN